MPKIIINKKICDRSPECLGIAICPNQALTYNKKKKVVVWNKNKCTFCLKCTLPESCPINAIVFARNEATEKEIIKNIKNDTRTKEFVWQERFGVQPGKPAIAEILDNSNFSTVLNSSKPFLIDVWHENFADCRLRSVPYLDLFKIFNLKIYKLDAQKYPKLAEKLKITNFPSLVIVKNKDVLSLHTGIIEEPQVKSINDLIKKALNN